MSETIIELVAENKRLRTEVERLTKERDNERIVRRAYEAKIEQLEAAEARAAALGARDGVSVPREPTDEQAWVICAEYYSDAMTFKRRAEAAEARAAAAEKKLAELGDG